MTASQLQTLKEHIVAITRFAANNEGWDIKPYPKVMFSRDNDPDDITAPTGHYRPDQNIIMLYVNGRSVKDCINTIAHELRHRHQDVTGQLDPEKLGESTNYTNGNDYLKEIEHDAFTYGNVLRRKYTESLQK